MGIKFFYKWLTSNYKNCITGFRTSSPPKEVIIDTFLIDMNGLFHNSAQRIFKYGNGAPRPSIFRTTNVEPVHYNERTQIACFQDVTKTLEELVTLVNPRKTLVLAIDGVAPASKINQQRQRRFRSAMTDMPVGSFNPISITPGTTFMDSLSTYIDWYIKKRISESDAWRRLKIVFSTEKQPGEGEHKLIEYIRKNGKDDETFCINALDADLVMLSLATFKPKFYLLRDEQYSRDYDYSFVSISGVRNELQKILFWKGCDEKTLIKDFILICFLCGNDFLPNIPSISIIENGLDTMINIYNRNAKHLIDSENKIILPAFKEFLERIGDCEEGMIIQRIVNKSEYIPDPMLEKYSTTSYLVSEANEASSDLGVPIVNFDMAGYKNEYYTKKGVSGSAAHSYLTGCQWVFTYYLDGVKDWTWLYPYNYAPFAVDIASSIGSYKGGVFSSNTPISPFEQLLCVIPPKCAYLLPKPLDSLLRSRVFARFSPSQFTVNCAGKKFEYEGIVELPPIDIAVISSEYSKMKDAVNANDQSRRNTTKNACVYAHMGGDPAVYRSKFGNIKNYTVDIQDVL